MRDVAASPTPSPRALTIVLALLAASALLPGLWATIAPASFYGSFPFGAPGWVSPLGADSPHLTADVGGFYLAFALLFAWASWRPERALVVPLCLAWSVFSVLHAGWHLFHLEPLGTTDAITSTTSLAAVLLGPGLALWLVRRGVSRGDRAPAGGR